MPDFEDYSIDNRTYRYFKGKPLYACGHGLSYTKFVYSNLQINAQKLGFVTVNVTLTNTETTMCVHGSCKVFVKNGKKERTYVLNSSETCLILEPKDWREMSESY